MNADGKTPTVTGNTYSETFSVSPFNVTNEALSAEVSRNVQLGWQADGEFYNSTFQNNN